MEFKVKRDFLPIFLVNLGLLLLLGVAIPFAYNAAVFVVVLAIVLSLVGFYNTAVIFASCKIENETLIFRTGVFKYEIKLNQIVKVTPAHNHHCSLALSHDRLRILTYDSENNQKVYYVSVEDNEKLASVITPTKNVAKAFEAFEKAVEKVETQPAANVTATTEPVAEKKPAAKKTTTTAVKKPATKKATTTKKTTTKKSTK